MKTTLNVGKVTITVEGLGNSVITDYIRGKLTKATERYNKRCDEIKANGFYLSSKCESVEQEWETMRQWSVIYKTVNEFVNTPVKRGRITFDDGQGYIEKEDYR